MKKTPQKTTVVSTEKVKVVTANPSKFDVSKIMLIASLFLFALFSFLLFDLKISDAGDDSNYIEMGYNFLHKGWMPTYQGPLYPIVLSIFIGIFGINVAVLKALSGIFLLLFIVVSYQTFRKTIPTILLILLLLFFAVNKHFVYYASQTFSEAFYMLCTAIMLYFFTRFFIVSTKEINFKKNIAHHFIVSLLILACFLTRTAAVASFGAVCGYFLLTKKWKDLGLAIGAFLITFAAYSLLKKVIWPNAGALQFTDQLKMLAQKDAYNATKGQEDFAGFVARFWKNSKQYLAGHLFMITGLESPKGDSERAEYLQKSLASGGFKTTLIYLLLLGSLWFSYTKNKVIFFAGLVATGGMLLTFLLLQDFWNQERLVLIYVPYLVLVVAYALYESFGFIQAKAVGKWVGIGLLAIMVLLSIKKSMEAVSDFSEERKETMDGNVLYGFSQDWQNYIELAKWSAEHVGKDTQIAVRKPSIAFIYGGRPFYGVYSVPTIAENDIIARKAPNGHSTYIVSLGIMNEQNALLFLRNNAKYSCISVQWNKSQQQMAADAAAGKQSTPQENAPKYTMMYDVPDTAKATFTKMAQDLKLTYTDNIKEMFTNMHKLNLDISAYPYDVLLNNLKQGKVHYMILASLRQNPYMKTENIISTLHRYAYTLQLKYPELFSSVRIQGKDEKAELVKINYDKIK